MAEHNSTARGLLARALAGAINPTSKEAGFLGQMAFDLNPPSDKQARWLAILADRYDTAKEAAHD